MLVELVLLEHPHCPCIAVVQYHVVPQDWDCDVEHGEPEGHVLVLVWVPPEQVLHAPQAPHKLLCVVSQEHGVPQAGYPLVLQEVEYPEPLPLILEPSIDWLHPAQFELTLVVQYQHCWLSDVEHGEPDGQVLVRVLYPPEHELQADHAPQAESAVESQTHGVPQAGYPLVLQEIE